MVTGKLDIHSHICSCAGCISQNLLVTVGCIIKDVPNNYSVLPIFIIHIDNIVSLSAHYKLKSFRYRSGFYIAILCVSGRYTGSGLNPHANNILTQLYNVRFTANILSAKQNIPLSVSDLKTIVVYRTIAHGIAFPLQDR